MLFTRECDYAIRIVRALKDHEKHKADDICEAEEIPKAFVYKILKKLENQQIVEVIRGTQGGCKLAKDPKVLRLYDIVQAIDPELAITHCIREKCSRDRQDDRCRVHLEMMRIQSVLEAELKAKTIAEILNLAE